LTIVERLETQIKFKNIETQDETMKSMEARRELGISIHPESDLVDLVIALCVANGVIPELRNSKGWEKEVRNAGDSVYTLDTSARQKKQISELFQCFVHQEVFSHFSGLRFSPGCVHVSFFSAGGGLGGFRLPISALSHIL
jgi:hypothetical protein